MQKIDKSKNWVAVYTKPRHEKAVAFELQKKGYEIYLPLLRVRKKWSDRKKWVEFPFFKSYLFAKTFKKDIGSLVSTVGLVRVIKFGENIAIVKDSSINSIKLMLNGGYNPTSTDYFIKGDPVSVKSGPLKGLTGEVVRIDNHNRLLVRIDAIKHAISIDIDRGRLKTLV